MSTGETPQVQPEEEQKQEVEIGVPKILEGLKGGKVTPTEAALLIAQVQAWDNEQWRRWKAEQDEKMRRWEKERESTPKFNPDELADKIAQSIAKLLQSQSQSQTKELPEWAQQLQKQMEEINKRLSLEEQTKREKELIEKAQQPLIAELEKERIERKRLEEKLVETTQQLQQLSSTGKEPPPNPLKMLKETVEDVKGTAKALGMKDPEEVKPNILNLQGAQIPISGSIPAGWIFWPSTISTLIDEIDKRADKWLARLVGPTKTTGKEAEAELIKLPPKSFIPEAKPPEAKLIEVKPAPTPPEVQVELIKIPPPPPEKVETQVTVSPPQEKKYKCVCGETFKTALEKARHVKKCPKAKVEKEKTKEEKKSGEPSQPSPN